MDSTKIKQLPGRHVYKLSKYESYDYIRRKDNTSNKANPIEIDKDQKKIPELRAIRLDQNTVKAIKQISLDNTDEKPKYHYFIHDKMDSILSSYQMKELIGSSCIILDNVFTGKSSVNCIKKNRLLQVGLEREIIEKEPLFDSEKRGSLVSTIFTSLLALGNIFLSLYTAKIDNQQLLSTYPGLKIAPIIFCIIFSIITICLIAFRYKEQHNIMINKIKNELIKQSTEDFNQFISSFQMNDYDIPELKHSRENADIIYPLNKYTIREQAVLQQYLRTNNKKEDWWIFIEDSPNVTPPILPQSSDEYRREIYRVLPLSYAEKRLLASTIDDGDINDPGIKPFGVDYVAKSLLQAIAIQADRDTKEVFLNKLYMFIDRNKNDYNYDVSRVVRLVAELSYTFHVDFSNVHNWEHVFSLSGSDSFSMKDRQLSEQLLINRYASKANKTKDLKNLVALIIKEFETNLYQMIEYGPELMTEDNQLILIKAIRCQTEETQDYCLAIAKFLYNQLRDAINNHNTFNPDDWTMIIEHSLLKLQLYNFGWFNATIIHNLLRLWDIKKSPSLKELLCTEVVQTLSQEQIFFYNHEIPSHESDNNNNQYEIIDVINDHSQLLNLTVKMSKADLSLPLDPFHWSGLLYLSDDERKKYAISLEKKHANYLIQYYQLLFEIFILKTHESGSVLCRQFFPSTNTYSSFADHINQLLELVETLGKNRDFHAAEGCAILKSIMFEYKQWSLIDYIQKLQKVYNQRTNKSTATIEPQSKEHDELLKKTISRKSDLTSKCLYYMALWDVLGFSIGSLVASLVFQEAGLSFLDDNKHKTLEGHTIPLDMGNTFARLIYLACMQSREGSFIAQEAIDLTDALTNYKHPSNPIIGYILSLSRFALPENCKERLRHHFIVLNEISSIIPEKCSIHSKDLHEYISDIYACGFLSDETRKNFFHVLLSDCEDNYYNDLPDKDIVHEYLNRYINHSSIKKYENASAKTILEDALTNGSPADTIYLLYSDMNKINTHVEIDKTEDIPDIEIIRLCTLISQQLIHTHFQHGIVLLVNQWDLLINFDNSDSRDYWNIAKELYEAMISKIDLYQHSGNRILMAEVLVDTYYHFFVALEERISSWKELHLSHFSEKSIANAKLFLSQQQQHIMAVLLYDAIHSKRAKISLLTWISYVLNHAKHKRVELKEYQKIKAENLKENWLIANVSHLIPIMDISEGSAINQTFVNALNLAIQSNNSTMVKEIQIIIQQNITSIVNTLFDMQEQREQIFELIEAFRHSYNPSILL